MSLGTILFIIIVIALLGGFNGSGGVPFYGAGYYGGGGLGLVLGYSIDPGIARQTLNYQQVLFLIQRGFGDGTSR